MAVPGGAALVAIEEPERRTRSETSPRFFCPANRVLGPLKELTLQPKP